MLKRTAAIIATVVSICCSTTALRAQRHWNRIYSDQDLSRDTITQKGITLIFINKEKDFSPKEVHRLQETFFKVYPQEIRAYNKNASRKVAIIIDPDYKGVAATAGDVIRISPEWMEQHPEDLDVVTHEAMHIVQAYHGPTGPGWITEGIADYARNEFGVNNAAAGWSLTPFNEKQSYTNAYRITARFLVWITRNYKKSFVRSLNTVMREGTYTDAFWKEQTGKTVEELWAVYSQHAVI